MVVVSYMTEPPVDERIQGLTYGTLTAEDRAKSRASWTYKEVLGSVLVMVIIIAAYLYFRG
jgi:SSS family solute:Na+ symporter